MKKIYLLLKTLALKVGGQVMFTRNDPQKHWVNGTIDQVIQLYKEIVVK